VNVRVLPPVYAELHDALALLVTRGYFAAARRLWADWEAGLLGIAATPRLYPPADDAPPGVEVRNYLTTKAKYRIVYQITPTEAVVLSFARTTRRAGHWHGRIP
jgi:hypothetical protein